MTAIVARAPCRVDLAGGTLDIWPLGQFFGGSCTVNVAIDVMVSARVEPAADGFVVEQGAGRHRAESRDGLLEDSETALVALAAEVCGIEGARVVLASDSPRGGGLGASSALTVALLAAFDRLHGEPRLDDSLALARVARDLEARLMRLPTGLQDHVPALVGGALVIEHRPGGERWNQTDVDLAELGRHMLVVYTGQSHFSAGNNWQVVRSALDGDREVVGLLSGIAESAAEAARALREQDWAALGRAVGRDWAHRRHLAPSVSSDQLELMLESAVGLGAWGGKACGAGGGGCLVVMAPTERLQSIALALEDLGGRVLDARPCESGLNVGPG